MAAAGLTLGSGTPGAAGQDNRGQTAQASRQPVPRGAGLPRQNQRITFVRSARAHGDTIRATAHGPVDGFGTARVVSFEPDAASGSFRGVWELTFKNGTIRYAFSGQARPVALEAQPSAPLALPAAPDPDRALVAGTFELHGGTGRFDGVTGSGAFQGWMVPNDDLPLDVPGGAAPGITEA